MSDRGTTVSRPPKISASARRRWVRKLASQPSLEGSESSNPPLSTKHSSKLDRLRANLQGAARLQ